MPRTALRLIAVVTLAMAAMFAVQARSKKHNSKAGAFDYYMLVLSYAPDFCAQSPGNQDPAECGPGSHAGFVVHGLWPQGETTRGPENCGQAPPLDPSIIQAMLQYFPSESLIEHEWKTHGTCSGLSAAAYFAAVKKARDSVTIPAVLTPTSQQSMAPADIVAKAAAANPSFPATAFRVSCYSDHELEELRVCLNKDLSPRACGSSAGMCTASSVTLLPVH